MHNNLMNEWVNLLKLTVQCQHGREVFAVRNSRRISDARLPQIRPEGCRSDDSPIHRRHLPVVNRQSRWHQDPAWYGQEKSNNFCCHIAHFSQLFWFWTGLCRAGWQWDSNVAVVADGEVWEGGWSLLFSSWDSPGWGIEWVSGSKSARLVCTQQGGLCAQACAPPPVGQPLGYTSFLDTDTHALGNTSLFSCNLLLKH